ncbi:MAG: hypothetical protein MAGBODY4_01584 [Candidatus Marinimicrobia bacterium]|nr:hypothetical protein [Candidatus Neomarinimicrobiota bacterium]
MKRLFSLMLLLVFSVSTLFADVDLHSITNISAGTGAVADEQDIALDGSNLYLVWNNTGQVSFKSSSNDGINWGNLTTVYGGSETVYYPVVAASQGNVYVTYWYDTAENQEIFFSRSLNNGSIFDTETQITTAINQAQTPRIAASGDTIFVAYEDRDSDWTYQIYLIRSFDAGATWSDPVNISSSDGNSRWCDIVYNGGNLCVTYNENTGSEYDDPDLFFASSDDFGVTWSTPVNITNNQAYNARLNMTVLDSTVYIVTSSKIDRIQDDIILYRSHDFGQTWESGLNISQNTGDSARPWVWVAGETPGNHRIHCLD